MRFFTNTRLNRIISFLTCVFRTHVSICFIFLIEKKYLNYLNLVYEFNQMFKRVCIRLTLSTSGPPNSDSTFSLPNPIIFQRLRACYITCPLFTHSSLDNGIVDTQRAVRTFICKLKSPPSFLFSKKKKRLTSLVITQGAKAIYCKSSCSNATSLL